MRPPVELRAKSSPWRQLSMTRTVPFSRATWPAVPVLAVGMASSYWSAAMACAAVAGWARPARRGDTLPGSRS